MKNKIIKSRFRNCGDKKVAEREISFKNLSLNIYKFNRRERPASKENILIICCFSEFGCETVGAMYCIPRILQEIPSKYKIVVGWYGREYFYRHLVDEFWEIKPENMCLREYCRAFHHESKNLKKIEKQLSNFGRVIPSDYLGKLAVTSKCFDCSHFWFTDCKVLFCPKCNSKNISPSILGNVTYWKPKAVRVPKPLGSTMELAKKYISGNAVGIFARGRKCYGRNLQPEFYLKLISLLKEKNYNPIWLGEKATTQPCPDPSIVDFSRLPESKNLDLTLSIVSQCKFTIQFWTASTRLAGMMGVPYLLFESPDQIYGKGQEGYRRNLCDFGPRKLSINHFLNVYYNNDEGIQVAKKCIEDMENKNFEDYIGLVENKEVVLKMQNKKQGLGE
jgi:hypothetical protein